MNETSSDVEEDVDRVGDDDDNKLFILDPDSIDEPLNDNSLLELSSCAFFPSDIFFVPPRVYTVCVSIKRNFFLKTEKSFLDFYHEHKKFLETSIINTIFVTKKK